MSMLTFRLLNREFQLKFNFYIPTRAQHILSKANRLLKKAKSVDTKQVIFAIISNLTDKDYAIFSHPEKENYFIQCAVKQQDVIVDFPFTSTDARSQLVHRFEYLLTKYKLTKETGRLFAPYPYYIFEQNSYGNGFQVHCGRDREFAATFMNEVLIELYELEPHQKIRVLIDTWKKFWV